MSVTTLDDLDSLLNPVPAQKFAEAAPEPSRGKATLNRLNQDLEATVQDLQGRLAKAFWWVRILGSVTMLAVLGIAAMAFYVKGDRVKRLGEAFEIIHYRETKALGANAVVLDEWVKAIEGIERKVQTLEGITPEEKALRLRALMGARSQAETLQKQFLTTLEESERERGKGASFVYRDPYLKREIKLDEESGGVIDLNKLREEIKETTRLDESTKGMEVAMLSTVPLADQVRMEAEKQRNTAGATGQPDPIPGLQAPAGVAPLQLPGAPPSPLGR